MNGTDWKNVSMGKNCTDKKEWKRGRIPRVPLSPEYHPFSRMQFHGKRWCPRVRMVLAEKNVTRRKTVTTRPISKGMASEPEVMACRTMHELTPFRNSEAGCGYPQLSKKKGSSVPFNGRTVDLKMVFDLFRTDFHPAITKESTFRTPLESYSKFPSR